MLAYTVICTFKNEALAQEWLGWMQGEHLAEVIAAGALDAEVVKMDGSPVRCEVRYHFESRDAFNRYEREHAARLRGEGLKKFPLDRGLSYVRSVGQTVGRQPPPDATELKAAAPPVAAAAPEAAGEVAAAIVEPKTQAAATPAKPARSRGGRAGGSSRGRKKSGGAKAASSETA